MKNKITKRTSVIVAMAVAVMLTIFACVSNQPPSAQAPKAGRPLVRSLPARVQGVELVGGTVRAKSGYQFVKQPNGTVMMARMGGPGVGGTFDCVCEGTINNPATGACAATIVGGLLYCTQGTCTGSCRLDVTVGGIRTGVIMY
jgi:hypothetical protein